jgi:SAM-dependent methyltransferase
MNEFDQIYASGGWDGKGSGPGSTEPFTREFRGVFEKLLVERKIKSVFDLGCGDWQWQRHVDWSGINYRGWDVSAIALEEAGSHIPLTPLGSPGGKFYLQQLDAFSSALWPEADLMIVKDVLHHISPFKARMLGQKSFLYDYVLWVVDLNEKGYPVNWPWITLGGVPSTIYKFDTSIEDYRYGNKSALLQINTPKG